MAHSFRSDLTETYTVPSPPDDNHLGATQGPSNGSPENAEEPGSGLLGLSTISSVLLGLGQGAWPL